MLLYKIISIKRTCDSIKIFTLAPLKEKISFKAGQFVMLSLLNEKGAVIDKRPYSIASSPEDNNLELAIKMVNGRFTSKLDMVKEGEVVGIEGPFGHFVFNDEKKAVFIAGGVGITPIIGILRNIARKNIKGDYLLLYSCKTKEDVLYENELEELKKHGIKIIIFLTRENKDNYESGRIDKDKILKYVTQPTQTVWFICGPLAMTTTIRKSLNEIGVQDNFIKSEGWG
ncbi:MAG: FAD-dependent oxidoreductase [Candidatus Bilamarchaeaceae archaeon]